MSWFNEAYRGVPPWDIGRPQPEFQKVADSGEAVGSVLDVGCGTGEHSILFASHGHPTLGIDGAPLAIEKAKEKAAKRGSKAEFRVADALALPALGRRFGTAIDSGLFHVFPDEERARYVEGLASVVEPGGKLFLLCFSEKEPLETGGPRRVTREEIQGAFSSGWTVESINESLFVSVHHGGEGARAWFARVTRTPSPQTI